MSASCSDSTTNDTLRVGDRAVPLAEIEAAAGGLSLVETPNTAATLLALVAEVRRLRAVERAARIVVWTHDSTDGNRDEALDDLRAALAAWTTEETT